MSRARPGFSLVELMIVIAVISILAAIAVPNIISMQLKARRSEVPATIDGIRACETAYELVFNDFVTTPTSPREDALLDRKLAPWLTSPEWTRLGYQPSGDVRGNYTVLATPKDFTVYGHADVDDDGEIVVYTGTREVPAAISPAYEGVY
jgi:type IV pilus assembly protein PilA